MPATVGGRPRAATISDAPPAKRRPALDLRRRLDPRAMSLPTLLRIGIVMLTVYACIVAVQHFGRGYNFFDMRIYHGAMVWWTHGGSLYAYLAPGTTLGFTYPPVAAYLMAPMALLPATAAGWVNLVASLAALAVLLVILLRPIADRYGQPRWFVVAMAVPLAGATEPVRETLGYGQINLLLGALVFADLIALRHLNRPTHSELEPGTDTSPTTRWLLQRLGQSGALAGVGVGIATAIKLTPGLFIIYFLITKQWRAAITSAVTAAGATLLTFLFAGDATTTYFTSVVTDTNRIGQVDATANQSLAALLARLYDSPTAPRLMWLAFAALLLAVGLSRAQVAHREGDELAAFTLVGLTTNAVCPISWSHHLVYVIPALVVLADLGLRRRGAARGLARRGLFVRGPAGRPALAGLRHIGAAFGLWSLFVYSPIWRFEHKLPLQSHYANGPIGVLGENSLALALILLVVFLPWRPGAEPAFQPEPLRRAVVRRPAATGS